MLEGKKKFPEESLVMKYVIHSSAETVFSVAVVKECLQECYTEL